MIWIRRMCGLLLVSGLMFAPVHLSDSMSFAPEPACAMGSATCYSTYQGCVMGGCWNIYRCGADGGTCESVSAKDYRDRGMCSGGSSDPGMG